MEKQQFLELIDRYLNGQASQQEEEWLSDYFNSFQKNQAWNEKELGIKEQLEEKMFQRLQGAIAKSEQPIRITSISKIWRYAAAAVILITLSTGLYFWKNSNKPVEVVNKVKNDIAPGGNKAILTLADGRKITLTDAANGELAEQAGIKITKTADGQLVYNILSDTSPSASFPVYNTLSTPKGGQYQIVLPDGTKVWLNAASSLRYPAAFTGKERSVELNGEAYFEVAKNKEKPFKVISGNTITEVLGTHFNVMSYNDENKQLITLLEGAVKVNKSTEKAILKPGQQAILANNNTSPILINNDVDLEEAVAWKNGYFMFLNEPVESIMRKISRWYNVEIVYQDKLQNKALWGTMSRFQNVSEVLKRLELTGVVHFKIEVKPNEERRIIVMK